jgi:hypothetical protein
MDYDVYNREERYLCSHLFRLLHEPTGGYYALRTFVGDSDVPPSFRIFAEVALIRDAYFIRCPDVRGFMDDLVRLIMRQESVEACRVYSELPEDFQDYRKTHPKQIKWKADSQLTVGEQVVYGAMQGMFNAKPDLVICLDNKMFVYEAKFTLGFDAEQIGRTRKIAEVWAKLLHSDLGFEHEPNVEMRTLGMSKYAPNISWETISRIAEEVYPADDRTRVALANAVRPSVDFRRA